MDDLRITIEGEETDGGRGRERVPTSESNGGSASRERTRAAVTERNRWVNAATAAKADLAMAQIQTIDTQSNAEAEAAKRALEVGDFDDHTARLGKIAELKVQRGQVEAEGRYWQSQPRLPDDPVEAYISRCTPETAKWMRDHPDDAFVIATNSDQRRAAKLNAAHSDAISEGLALDSKEYFAHVETFLNGSDEGRRHHHRGGGSSDGESGAPRVTVLKRGEAPAPGTKHVKMRRAEYEAATEHLTWGFDDPGGRFKKNDPIGVAEYLRRRQIQDNSPEWQRLD